MRNIINTHEIEGFLREISQQKRLDDYPNIKKWLLSNVRKHIINNGELDNDVDLNGRKDILSYIAKHGINTPVHFAKLGHQLKDKIMHSVDFLLSEYGKDKDVSKISFPQSIVSAEIWLNQQLKRISKNLAAEEDFENTKPFLDTVGLDGKQYTWVKINSKKGISREAHIMHHCIETYWDREYPKQEVAETETPFYSLRDEENNSILTAYITKEQNQFEIREIKERFNELVGFNHLSCVQALTQHLLFQRENIVEVKISDDSVSQWFIDSNLVKEKENLSIIDYLKDGKQFPIMIEENKIVELNKYFKPTQIFNSLHFDSISLNESNYVPNVTYYAKKLEIKDLQNQKVSFLGNEAIFTNSHNCDFFVADNAHSFQIYHEQNELIFKNSSNNNVSVNTKCQSSSICVNECDNIFILDSNKNECVLKMKKLLPDSPVVEVLSILSKNIHIAPQMKKCLVQSVECGMLSPVSYNKGEQDFLEPYSEKSTCEYFFRIYFRKSLEPFLTLPFKNNHQKYDNDVSSEVHIMNAIIYLYQRMLINESPENQTLSKIFSVEEFLVDKEKYIKKLISNHNWEELSVFGQIEKIYDSLLLTTNGYDFTNGLDVELAKHYDKQKSQIQRLNYVSRAEEQFKNMLQKEEYPVSSFFVYLEKQYGFFNNLLSMEACKNMFIRAIKEDGKKVKNYLDGECINDKISKYLFSMFNDSLISKNNMIKDEKSPALNVHQSLLLKSILKKPYDPKFDFSLESSLELEGKKILPSTMRLRRS